MAADDESDRMMRAQLVSVAEQRQEVFAFREAELADIRKSRQEAEHREDVASRNCAKRVAEMADELARKAIETEMASLDDEEAELAQINALRMEVSRHEADVKRLSAELERKKAAAQSVGEEYESVLSAVERVRATVEDQQAADDHEDAALAAEQARLLSHLTAATRGATARLEGDWDRKRQQVSAEVEHEWSSRLSAISGSKSRLKEQLAGVASDARMAARDTSSAMAQGAASAFEAHAAPLCRQFDADVARLGSRAAAVDSARSRVRAALVAERESPDASRSDGVRHLRRVLDAAEAEADSVEALDPVTGGAGAGFTAEAREQLAAVRNETLAHWETLESVGEEEMAKLAVLLASTAAAHETADGSNGSVSALKMFRGETTAETRRIMATSDI